MAKQAGGITETGLAPAYRIWTDKAFILLSVLAVAIAVGLLGTILSVYPQLPERLPILFNAQGQADVVANKVYLYRLPLGVFLIIVFNTFVSGLVLRNNPFAARMLMLTACWIGVLILAGLWFIIR